MRARLFACALALAVSACSGSSSTEVTAPSTVKCDITVDNSLHGTAPAAGTSGSVTVTTNRDCTWNATSGAGWVTITAGSTGQGPGSVSYTVAANDQPAQRRASVDVSGNQVSIVQDAAPCRFTVSASDTTVPASGGKLTVKVDAVTGCTWSAQSSAPWLSISSVGSGNGNGSVTFDAAVNEGDARSASLTVAGTTIAVSQTAAPCTFTVAPTSQNVPSTGGGGSIGVTVRPGCAWTAASNASWIAIASGASGKGSGAAGWQVAVNGGDARTGTITVAGTTITIVQAAAPCTFSVAPLAQSAPVEGASGSANVMVRPGCTWTAVSAVPWITVTSGASGNGSGAVTFAVAPNPGPPRTGSLTIAGFAFTVDQATVPCDYNIAPRTQFIPASGGTGATSIFTGPTCPWSATPNVPWITILGPANGIGAGRVVFAIAPNPAEARSGTISVEGQIYTVFQDPPR
jgi:all-beta uncharacterized protein/BACON domain-containing protein